MKKIISSFTVLFFAAIAVVNAQSAKELQETAKSFIQQGDYSNAVLVLNKATALDPSNMDITKDLAFTYYLQKENAKALETIKPVLERDDADDQSFQIAGNIYKQLAQPKECEKLYRKALKKFPDNGPLYNDFGELLWAQQDYNAIKQWEKGIEVDPSYSKNYYNACKFYYLTTDKTWSLLYGEIFVNMEPFTNRSIEIKNILLESYKKLFTDATAPAAVTPNQPQSEFSQSFQRVMKKQGGISSAGITAESLTMIRTRFILDWYSETSSKFPFRLFELQRQLLQDGTFEAYNQWLFGSVQNLTGYQNWVNTHSTEYNEFTRFQRGRIFKIPSGQYYH
ncbi:MAG: tetratricopeptide repeat protein [Ferruginibacter sp.]